MEEAETNASSQWDAFFSAYGRAVFEAQELERNLATAMSFFEARKRAVLKRPTPNEIDTLMDELDGEPIGELIKRLNSFHVLDPSDLQTLNEANSARRVLVHHIGLIHAEKFSASDVVGLCHEVGKLRAAVFHGLYLSARLAETEINRMSREAKSRANGN
ncbi:hypothetical protein G6N82_06840 [Altererythrobacter sp. BO-6]|uniref:hypothetical protein n=1 Tax=Altererythrobacter sp. BO-6 TaxID=2604537 RepID=UPI0013E1AF80|nr:hypothetical protein [Altererythrobacter sp. BO-6]QIG53908.1 hypothetical protein G6N82_06840 [Altererythrobacter sp. BO-6]